MVSPFAARSVATNEGARATSSHQAERDAQQRHVPVASRTSAAHFPGRSQMPNDASDEDFLPFESHKKSGGQRPGSHASKHILHFQDACCSKHDFAGHIYILSLIGWQTIHHGLRSGIVMKKKSHRTLANFHFALQPWPCHTMQTMHIHSGQEQGLEGFGTAAFQTLL